MSHKYKALCLTSASSTRMRIEIQVRDTGIGIQKKDIGKIFDPYFTTKEKGKGTGLGLAAVHRTVEAHNGTIKVKSTVGKGSSFIVRLPLDKSTKKADKKIQNLIHSRRAVISLLSMTKK